MRRYRKIYLEISGFCNARCPYCHTGAGKIKNGKAIDTALLKEVLRKLLDEDLIKKGGVISLYNWGEPFLHPQINKIFDCVRDTGLKYALSTNASIVPQINAGFIKSLDHIIFSMPGFSQNSYDRIHGFNFGTIIKNIKSIISECRKYDFKGYFKIAYHVYRFNAGELKECERFANENNIIFEPYYAILNHWWKLQGFITGRLRQEEKDSISKELFLDGLKNARERHSRRYFCPQFNYLVIDESANVVTCCQLPNDHKDYSCGNILNNKINEILVNKENQGVCKECIDSGVSFYLNNTMKAPGFYRKSVKQNYLYLNWAIKKILTGNF